MSTLHSMLAAYQFNRVRTLATLDKIEQETDPQAALGYRPGPGRAHIAWQLMHLAITEELFATERLPCEKKPTPFADLIPRFRGGSTPDDNIPTASQIRQVLAESRAHLLETLLGFSDIHLGVIPTGLAERKLTLLDAVHILSWHEAHHQGQAHITLNLFRARAGA